MKEAVDILAELLVGHKQAVRELRAEVDCRIEHGALTNGHLEYVRDRLDKILEEPAFGFVNTRISNERTRA